MNLYLIIFTWFLYHFIEYCLHKLGHSSYSGYINKIHKKHHVIFYPPTKLMDFSPYKTGYIYGISDGILAYGPLVLLIISIFYYCLNTYYFYCITSQFLLSGYIQNYVHTHIHTKDTWLEKYKWFQDCRKRHYIHHRHYNRNINIIDPIMDQIMSTYKLYE